MESQYVQSKMKNLLKLSVKVKDTILKTDSKAELGALNGWF